MKIIEVKALALPEVKVVRFARFSDARGYFTEPFRATDFAAHPELAALRGKPFVQMNESFSRAGVLRGLHFQWNPYMGKLVRPVFGHMVDLVCDIRKGSPTFGKALTYDMPISPERETSEWIWVPPGFAHGNFFPKESLIEYLCTGEYSPGCEAGIYPLSNTIDWSLGGTPLPDLLGAAGTPPAIVSDKDRDGFSLTAWSEDPRSENFIM